MIIVRMLYSPRLLQVLRRRRFWQRWGTVALLALAVMVPDATAQLLQGRGGQQNREIVAQFDTDKDGRLNTAERNWAPTSWCP